MAQEAERISAGPVTSPAGTLMLALMRIAIGWHFLYEGIVKLLDSHWTAAGYLRASTGPLAEWFHRIANDPLALRIVDQMNIWGLILIGGCLMLGLLTRFAALGGVAMLALYYAAYPPLVQSPAAGVAEGSYLIVSKNLVELLALFVVVILPANNLGLDRYLFGRPRKRRASVAATDDAAELDLSGEEMSRRRILAGLVGVPFVGAFVIAVMKRRGWESHEVRHLTAKIDAASGATIKIHDFSQSLKDLKGTLPLAEIGGAKKLKLSRMILGGNLIGGWAHARDLIYVDKLVKAYHRDEKVFETFKLAEACGVNTVLTNPVLCRVINDYWRLTGGKIQFISDCGGSNVIEMTQRSIDQGACACYVQGQTADDLVARGQFDTIEKMLELVRKNGLPAGIGGHKLQTIQACVEKGFKPDFWMKTLHQTNYWSAQPKEQHDNIWCENPDETIAFMKGLPQPWIAFKILAAGAQHPSQGFRYAFANGADIICVGMYDFQIIEDVNIALDVLKGKLDRQRPWCA